MAKIHKTKSALKETLKYNRKRLSLLWIFYFVLLLVGLPFMDAVVFGSVFTFVFMIIIYISFELYRKNRIIKNGLIGEERALNIFKKMNNEYNVYQNVIIEFEGKESELDFVVVGKNGIFVIEVKNHNGVIEGQEEDRYWVQHKVGRQGGEYTNQFYNPTKQVRTHVYRLAGALKEAGMHTWVQGLVFFSNEKVEVMVDTKKIPVMQISDHLCGYITDQINKRTLTEVEIEKIEKVLTKNIEI